MTNLGARKFFVPELAPSTGVKFPTCVPHESNVRQYTHALPDEETSVVIRRSKKVNLEP